MLGEAWGVGPGRGTAGLLFSVLRFAEMRRVRRVRVNRRRSGDRFAATYPCDNPVVAQLVATGGGTRFTSCERAGFATRQAQFRSTVGWTAGSTAE